MSHSHFFCQKGVCSSMRSHRLTFYAPSHYLASFQNKGMKSKFFFVFHKFLCPPTQKMLWARINSISKPPAFHGKPQYCLAQNCRLGGNPEVGNFSWCIIRIAHPMFFFLHLLGWRWCTGELIKPNTK